MAKKQVKELAPELEEAGAGAETIVEEFVVAIEEAGEKLAERGEALQPIMEQPAEPVLINWTERLGRARVRRETTAEEMEGLVVGEGIGSPYYVILGGERRVLSSVAQAMGFGAVKFLRTEELAKIPEGEPL